jgi:hemolysin III
MKYYSPLEEKTNIISHAIGLCLGIAALVVMVVRASLHGDAWHIVGASIFGAGLIILYAASTIYHSARKPQARKILRVIDHATIYVLIAATYTPFTLVTLNGWVGWLMFGIVWALALAGIILKLFFTGRYDILSTLMYVFMGWMIIFAAKPLVENLSADGLAWLIAGGVAYTVGAIVYGIRQIRFNHAIFHLFVLLGSFCHFVTVYSYVLPTASGAC